MFGAFFWWLWLWLEEGGGRGRGEGRDERGWSVVGGEVCSYVPDMSSHIWNVRVLATDCIFSMEVWMWEKREGRSFSLWGMGEGKVSQDGAGGASWLLLG